MGYLYLAISKFCGAAKMAAMKNCGNADDSTGTSVKVNAVRSGIILVVSVIVFAVSRAATADGVWIAALSGVSNALNMLSWLVCATAVSLCIVETFVMIGSVVFPLVLSPLLYAGETVSAAQWAGAGVILAAVVLFCVGRDVKFGKKGIVWIAVCTLSSAGCNVTAKLYAVRAGSEYVAFFNLVTFVIVFAFFAVVAAITVLKNRKKTDSAADSEPAADSGRAADSGPVEYSGRAADSERAEEKDPQPREFFGLPKRTYFRIAIAAVGMYATNYFMTLAAGALPSGVLYPLSYGAGFVLTAIMDTVFFKQKLTLPRAVATVLAVVGAVLTAL